jgi:signal transduction histidine kinase
LIEEFYELSVIDDENYNITLERLNISATAENCILGYYALLESKKIKMDITLPEEALFVIGNTLALERIFQNLIQNSIKFAFDSIHIKLEEQDICCVFTISNNTKALTSADITHLFDRFYTADKSRSEGNTGLGLYIVKILLERIHGTIIETSLEEEWFTIKIAFNKE